MVIRQGRMSLTGRHGGTDMVKIVTDTTSCISWGFAQQNEIPVIPQVINFGTESYLEGVDLDIATFMQKLKSSAELPKTAAPPPELFVEVFRKLVPERQTILCLHPSSEISGTVRSATVAALEFPEADIRVIDTRLVASPLAELVKLAATWAHEDLDADTIEMRIRRLAKSCRIFFLVPTLEFLIKGGRIGGAQALVGSLLQIKPILALANGKVEPLEKARTFKHALNRLKQLVATEYPQDRSGYLTVLHAGVPEQGQALADDFRSNLHLEEVLVYDMPPAIVTHGGPGILGAAFFTNPDGD